MKEVIFQSSNAFEWLQVLHENIPSTIENNKLTVSKSGGEGYIKALKIQEGLNATIVDITLSNPITYRRQPHEINSHYVLNLFTSNTFVIDNDKMLNLEHYGITFYSATTNNAYVVPANKPIRAFILDFSKEWLQNAIDGYTDSVFVSKMNSILIHDNPVSKYETLDYQYSKFLRDLYKDGKEKSLLQLNIYALELLSYFFERLIHQNDNPELQAINSLDMANLQTARQTIENQWNNYPTNEELAKMSGMSLSKFNNLFKVTFGLTPYQYHLKFKLDTAYTLLSQKKYSVSEVGNLIGYSNLSKFSAAFKKAHNILPNEI